MHPKLQQEKVIYKYIFWFGVITAGAFIISIWLGN